MPLTMSVVPLAPIARITSALRGFYRFLTAEKLIQVDPTADLENARSLARDVGLEVYSIGESERTDFWRPFYETYPKLFPITQTMVNACWDSLPDRTLITFDFFRDIMLPELPPEQTGLDTYRTGAEGRAVQEESFRRHIDLAKRVGKPLMIAWSSRRAPSSASRWKRSASPRMSPRER